MRNRICVLAVMLFFSTGITSVVAQVEDYDKKDTPRKDRPESFDYESNDDGKKWDWTKARIGGNFGMAFNSGGLLIDATPTFGYKVHKMVEVGLGYKIFYYKDDNIAVFDGSGNFQYYLTYRDFIHGPVVYGRFNVWQGVFLMSQYEMANKEPYYIDIDNPNDRINVHHLLLGGGYSSAIGTIGQVNISLLYNVLDQDESIYQFGTFGDFPLLLNISVGFGIGGNR